MTNNIHFIELTDAPANACERYSIITDDPFPTTNDAARELMLATLLALSTRMIDDAARIAADDFSDDDTDYFPARANAYAQLTFALTTCDFTPLDMLDRLLHDYDFINDIITCDTNLPLDIDFAD